MSRHYEMLQHAFRDNRAVHQTSSLFDFTEASALPLKFNDSQGAAKASEPIEARLRAEELRPAERGELLKLINGILCTQDGIAPRCIAFCGVDSGTSSSWIAACTGELVAENPGADVCIVDANLHDSSLHRLLEIRPTPGILDAVLAGTPAHSMTRRVAHKLWVLTLGSLTAPLESQTLSGIRAGIQDLRGQFPYTVVIGSPVKKSVDLLSFASVLDGALLVVDADSTRRCDALAARQCLEAGRIPVLGAILDNHESLPDWIGHL